MFTPVYRLTEPVFAVTAV